jgi:hypothetical protein
MHTRHEMLVRGRAPRAFDLAASVEAWFRILPYHRWVRILRTEGNRRLVAIPARHRRVPLAWRCEQELQPEIRRIPSRTSTVSPKA